MSDYQHEHHNDPTLAGLARRVSEHVESRVEYAKLTMYEKLAVVQVKRYSLGIIIAIFLFVLLFVSVAAGIWLGKKYEDYAIGFAIVGGVYVVLLLLYLLLRKSVFERKMLDSVITMLCAEQDDDDDDEEA